MMLDEASNNALPLMRVLNKTISIIYTLVAISIVKLVSVTKLLETYLMLNVYYIKCSLKNINGKL